MVGPLRIAQNEKTLAFRMNIHRGAPTADKAPNNQVDKTTHSVYVSQHQSPTTLLLAQ